MNKYNSDLECVVIGSGIIGLSIARSLITKNKEVVIVEKNNSFGVENSSRNSGVIHAGIYYKNGSLKSKFCNLGNKLLYKFAENKKIKYNNCGKLIVAKNLEESKSLLKIQNNAKKNGVTLEYLDKKQIKRSEPNLESEAALFSPTSGIVDVYDIMLNILADFEGMGGRIAFNSKVIAIKPERKFIRFFVDNQTSFTTKLLINCAGLNSHLIAKNIYGINKNKIPKIRYIKGNYMKLNGKSPFNKLIYPLPTKDGLGIHSTLDFNQRTYFGPDEREVSCIDFNVDTDIEGKFYNSIKSFWPDIKKEFISPDFSGIRTKTLNNDFIIHDHKDHNIPGIINLYGIDSPGVTSSIPLGEYVANKCNDYLENSL